MTRFAYLLKSDVESLALEAQRGLLPYLLGFIGVGLPLFVWSSWISLGPVYCLAFSGLIGVNALAFIWLSKRDVTHSVSAQLWRQGMGAGLWTVTLLILSLASLKTTGGHPVFFVVCVGAAVGIIFFSSPVWSHLILLSPVAMIGPVLSLRGHTEDPTLGTLAGGGLIMAFAFGIILNRHLRHHFVLKAEQERLSQEQSRLESEARAQQAARTQLLETLNREMHTTLVGVKASLINGLEFLARAPAPRGHLQDALGEIARVQTLLEQTLDNETLSHGDLETKTEAFAPDAIAQHVFESYQAEARARHLDFSLNVESCPDHGAALGDRERAMQIVDQLVKNALNYTPHGRVELKVSLNSDHIRYEITDSGPGLSEAELELAFAPYGRVRRTCGAHAGAGLGLSLCRALADLMKGRLGVQSQPDIGSKFWLELPYDARIQTQDLMPEIPEWTRHRDLKVLIIAPSDLKAAHLRQTLESLGHRCLLSARFERAAHLAAHTEIDAVIIADTHFERDAATDGTPLCYMLESLKKLQSESTLRLFAALDTAPSAALAQSLGVDPLMWPLSREALQKALCSR